VSDCEYVRENYGVPAHVGMLVVVNGKPGIIAEDRGHHIGVNFDHDKPGVISTCHPTWKVEYTMKSGEIRQLTKAQQRAKDRYQRYREYSDCFDSFLDFCYWDAENQKAGY